MTNRLDDYKTFKKRRLHLTFSLELLKRNMSYRLKAWAVLPIVMTGILVLFQNEHDINVRAISEED